MPDTLTTDDVRSYYAWSDADLGGTDSVDPSLEAEFDLWLDTLIRIKQAEALEQAAALRRGADTYGVESVPASWLEEEARKLRAGAPSAAPSSAEPESRWRVETDPKYIASANAAVKTIIGDARARLRSLGPGVQKAALNRAIGALTGLLVEEPNRG